MCTHESIVNVSNVKHKKRKKSVVGGFVDIMLNYGQALQHLVPLWLNTYIHTILYNILTYNVLRVVKCCVNWKLFTDKSHVM